VFSSACIASRKSNFEFQEAETLRPLKKYVTEVNANNVEEEKLPRLMHADSDEEEEHCPHFVSSTPTKHCPHFVSPKPTVEAGDRLTVEVEGSKRRKFIEKEVGDAEGESGEPEGDCVEGYEQDAGDFRELKKMVDPKVPSREEVETHEMTHLPYRNWCRHCVMGRGVEATHRRAVRDVGAIPEIHVDFCFPGSVVGNGQNLTVVVARDRDSRMMLSEVVPTKGSTGLFAASRVACFIRELGCGGATVILKSDQEPAIVALTNEITRLRAPALTQPEQSPVGSSGSNGVVERGIQSFQMMARVMKSALEEKWKVTIPDDHAVLTWMTGYASFLLNRFEIGKDGKSSYERLKGKKAKVSGLEFAECLWFKVKEKKDGIGKLAIRWKDGVYLGVRAASGEVIVGTEEGVFRTRTVKRKPKEERWLQENVGRVVGVPWKTSKDDEGDGPAREGVIKIDAKVMGEAEEEGVRTSPPLIPRSFTITRGDLVEHGFSEGCPGCNAMLRGKERQKHSDACRRRLLVEMKEKPK